ncbi:MAG: hypothetical protein H0V92_03000 [Pseudonocardiales bacterium]|nr:hypothetical protein [Pseudonocardiales bacterium]
MRWAPTSDPVAATMRSVVSPVMVASAVAVRAILAAAAVLGSATTPERGPSSPVAGRAPAPSWMNPTSSDHAQHARRSGA